MAADRPVSTSSAHLLHRLNLVPWDVHLPVARAAAVSRSRCPSALDQAEPILVVSLSALLAVSGSNSAADTCTWSPTDPIPRGRSLMVTVAVAPLASSPSWQSMLRSTVRAHWPWVAPKDRSCTPPGTVVLQVSARVTADAGDGPRLVIVTVYVRACPGVAGSADSAIWTDRSAAGLALTTVESALFDTTGSG